MSITYLSFLSTHGCGKNSSSSVSIMTSLMTLIPRCHTHQNLCTEHAIGTAIKYTFMYSFRTLAHIRD